MPSLNCACSQARTASASAVSSRSAIRCQAGSGADAGHAGEKRRSRQLPRPQGQQRARRYLRFRVARQRVQPASHLCDRPWGNRLQRGGPDAGGGLVVLGHVQQRAGRGMVRAGAGQHHRDRQPHRPRRAAGLPGCPRGDPRGQLAAQSRVVDAVQVLADAASLPPALRNGEQRVSDLRAHGVGLCGQVRAEEGRRVEREDLLVDLGPVPGEPPGEVLVPGVDVPLAADSREQERLDAGRREPPVLEVRGGEESLESPGWRTATGYRTGSAAGASPSARTAPPRPWLRPRA